ncbi:hypothetical protein C8R45DRAFT_1090447 [Mycena sanguinolenta]|nr:hypothetical protein C8R45DRAFT_1090447 [Mycena sanguinolenta]
MSSRHTKTLSCKNGEPIPTITHQAPSISTATVVALLSNQILTPQRYRQVAIFNYEYDHTSDSLRPTLGFTSAPMFEHTGLPMLEESTERYRKEWNTLKLQAEKPQKRGKRAGIVVLRIPEEMFRVQKSSRLLQERGPRRPDCPRCRPRRHRANRDSSHGALPLPADDLAHLVNAFHEQQFVPFLISPKRAIFTVVLAHAALGPETSVGALPTATNDALTTPTGPLNSCAVTASSSCKSHPLSARWRAYEGEYGVDDGTIWLMRNVWRAAHGKGYVPEPGYVSEEGTAMIGLPVLPPRFSVLVADMSCLPPLQSSRPPDYVEPNVPPPATPPSSIDAVLDYYENELGSSTDTIADAASTPRLRSPVPGRR